MSDFSRPAIRPLADESGEWRIYRGNSMLRVFTPGDLLRVESLVAAQAKLGDIIVFDAPNGTVTVHRLIGHAPGGMLRTMGDNNPEPDAETIAPDTPIFRVVAVRGADGKIRDVARGDAGLAEFRRNRRRRWWGAELPRYAAGICRRLWCFKHTVKKSVRFGDEEIFYSGDTPVARRDRNGRLSWKSPWHRVIYKIGER